MSEPPTPAAGEPATTPQPIIPTWVRVLVILTVLPLWAVGVLFSMIAEDRLPDAAWMAIPSAVIVAAAPTWRWPSRGQQSTSGGGQ